MAKELICIRGLCKSFELGDRTLRVFENFDLDIDPKEFTVIIGRSGCGKTTLLRLIGGLIRPERGSVSIPSGISPGMVFQEPRLMPWLDCLGNIRLGFSGSAQECREVMELVGLKGFERAYPSQLSGGMQQRAALARCLVRRPGLLLMDEPFVSLDDKLRLDMQGELLRIKRQSGCGIIFVTHDMREAERLADRIVNIEDLSLKGRFDEKEKQ